MPDIGSDIAAAINGYLKAMRCLKRKEVTIWQIGQALGLPEPIVEKAFSEFKMVGASLAKNERKSAKIAHEFSRVVELKSK